MDRAGTETWLMHVLRHCDHSRVRFDFLVHADRPYAYADEIRSLGGRLILCREPHRLVTYGRNFRRAVATNGPYDAVHSHLHHFNGIVLRLAARAGIGARIAHSHTSTLEASGNRRPLRRFYVGLTGRWIRSYATAGLACSRAAATAQFGQCWPDDPRWSIHHCAIDLDPFRAPVDVAAVRAEWNIPQGAVVLGHVGRFAAVKNHRLVLDVAATLVRRYPNLRLLLVGEGPLRESIEQRIRALGIESNCILTGSRGDVPRLLKAIDALVFPSHYEGLGLALVEAQAAGVPCVCSDLVPEEADVVPGMVERLSLAAGVEAWADAVARAVDRHRTGSGAVASPWSALAAVERSPFNIATEVVRLERFYHETCAAAWAA